MVTRLEYAPKGLIGVLTPQANTTVEPELSILAPVGVGLLTARLTSTASTMQERLIAYGEGIDRCLEQFANAPVSVAAFACTGASYLIDPASEREMLSDITKQRGIVVITAAQAVLDAFAALGATRVGMISPYGGALHDIGVRYWQESGLKVANVTQLKNDETAFHPIYALAGASSAKALEEMAAQTPDAIVILGTGLPSLGQILAADATAAVPVLSPNLCLMWRCMTVLEGQSPSARNLMPWLTGTAWSDRYKARCLV
ncbi:MAG: hypothetical protein AB8B60_11670 [Sulfitobacter sp.]